MHHRDQVGLGLEADAGTVGQGDLAVDDVVAVGEAAERLEQVWVALVAAEPEAGGAASALLLQVVRRFVSATG